MFAGEYQVRFVYFGEQVKVSREERRSSGWSGGRVAQ